jgi:Fe-S cluster assembly protein SufD
VITIEKDEKRIIPLLIDQEVNTIEVRLAGEGGEVEIVGLVVGKGDDARSLDAYITHAAPNTKSNVNVRAVLKNKSSFAFRGNVKIENGAKGADAYLRSDALLFDEAKMGDDTPALEILEQDVKAGHAATIGKVDENMIFYLMSRGLSRRQSEKMLVEGFIKPILEKIKTLSNY